MHNVLHHRAILQSCCQQFLPQIPASIPACVRPKARQQKFSAEILSRNSWWAGNRSWVCCWCEAELVWIAAVQADSLVGIVFPQDSAQGNLLESGLGITSGSSSSPALVCVVSSTLWVGHDSFFLFFFFCKVTKSLLSLSHLLPQCELNLQLLMFLFISVAWVLSSCASFNRNDFCWSLFLDGSAGITLGTQLFIKHTHGSKWSAISPHSHILVYLFIKALKTTKETSPSLFFV